MRHWIESRSSLPISMRRKSKRARCLTISTCRRSPTVSASSIMPATSFVAGLPTTRAVQGDAMLNFPNDSRSYDATRRAVRFWGYDGPMEVSFFVTTEALQRLHRSGPDEQELLKTFDAHQQEIRTAAERSYKRGRQGSYALAEKALQTP